MNKKEAIDDVYNLLMIYELITAFLGMLLIVIAGFGIYVACILNLLWIAFVSIIFLALAIVSIKASSRIEKVRKNIQ